MTDYTRNERFSPAQPSGIDTKAHCDPKNRSITIECLKERIVDFVTQKPGTAVVSGVILGAALATLVRRFRK